MRVLMSVLEGLLGEKGKRGGGVPFETLTSSCHSRAHSGPFLLVCIFTSAFLYCLVLIFATVAQVLLCVLEGLIRGGKTENSWECCLLSIFSVHHGLFVQSHALF